MSATNANSRGFRAGPEAAAPVEASQREDRHPQEKRGSHARGNQGRDTRADEPHEWRREQPEENGLAGAQGPVAHHGEQVEVMVADFQGGLRVLQGVARDRQLQIQHGEQQPNATNASKVNHSLRSTGARDTVPNLVKMAATTTSLYGSAHASTRVSIQPRDQQRGAPPSLT